MHLTQTWLNFVPVLLVMAVTTANSIWLPIRAIWPVLLETVYLMEISNIVNVQLVIQAWDSYQYSESDILI